MAQRPALRTAAVVLCGALFVAFLVAGIADWAAVAKLPQVTTFEQAEFVASNARRPPDDSAAWKTVKLPDEWRKRPDLGAHGWYRVKFDLAEAPEGLQNILVRYRRAQRLSFFVNGKPVGGAIQASSISAERGGVRVDRVAGASAPPSLLRAGENLIHVRMEASPHPALMHGLGRVYFGDARPLRRMLVGFGEQAAGAMRNATAMALAAGIITLFLWLAHRSDRVPGEMRLSDASLGVRAHDELQRRVLQHVLPEHRVHAPQEIGTGGDGDDLLERAPDQRPVEPGHAMSLEKALGERPLVAGTPAEFSEADVLDIDPPARAEAAVVRVEQETPSGGKVSDEG